MRFALPIIATLTLAALATACARVGSYPSLAPRAGEAVDPRVPIVADPAPGEVNAGVASSLAAAVAKARAGRGEFDALARRAQSLAAVAGPRPSESWVVAQQALSALSATHGATTGAAATIDALAADRIAATRWINPATRAAIEAAAAEVGAINAQQAAILKQLGARLGT
jgi:hypothetical protein